MHYWLCDSIVSNCFLFLGDNRRTRLFRLCLGRGDVSGACPFRGKLVRRVSSVNSNYQSRRKRDSWIHSHPSNASFEPTMVPSRSSGSKTAALRSRKTNAPPTHAGIHGLPNSPCVDACTPNRFPPPIAFDRTGRCSGTAARFVVFCFAARVCSCSSHPPVGLPSILFVRRFVAAASTVVVFLVVDRADRCTVGDLHALGGVYFPHHTGLLVVDLHPKDEIRC